MAVRTISSVTDRAPYARSFGSGGVPPTAGEPAVVNPPFRHAAGTPPFVRQARSSAATSGHGLQQIMDGLTDRASMPRVGVVIVEGSCPEASALPGGRTVVATEQLAGLPDPTIELYFAHELAHLERSSKHWWSGAVAWLGAFGMAAALWLHQPVWLAAVVLASITVPAWIDRREELRCDQRAAHLLPSTTEDIAIPGGPSWWQLAWSPMPTAAARARTMRTHAGQAHCDSAPHARGTALKRGHSDELGETDDHTG